MNLNKTETFLLATSAGLLGATLALIFAPQSGRRTRRKIGRAAADISDRASEFCEDLNDRLEDLADEWWRIGSEGLKQGEELRESLLQALSNSRDLISSKIDRIREDSLKE